MKARKISSARRVVQRTVLLVGEGYAEVAFIKHLKALYITRGCGIALTVDNARGKTALHVVQEAIRKSKNGAFDVVAALFDTDTGWDATTQTIARKAQVKVVPCQPCFEAMLLALHGEVHKAKLTEYYKRAFENKFGKPANVASLYAAHFPKELLEQSRLKSPELGLLLALLTASD